MKPIPPHVRAIVIARAGGRCEYCRIGQQLQIGGFEIDHVVPRSQGGTTVLDNLSLACPHCNNRKSDHLTHLDSVSGFETRLFDPRNQSWADHFRWSSEGTWEIEGHTPCGRATVACLELNHPDMVGIRVAFAQLGFPPQ